MKENRTSGSTDHSTTKSEKSGNGNKKNDYSFFYYIFIPAILVFIFFTLFRSDLDPNTLAQVGLVLVVLAVIFIVRKFAK